MDASSLSEFAALVGIDWADRKHDVCLLPAGSSKREFSVLAHRPEAIAQWAEGLRQRFGGRPIAGPGSQRKAHPAPRRQR